MPKMYNQIGDVSNKLRAMAKVSDEEQRIANCKTCRLIDKHGINSDQLCIELGIEPSMLVSHLLGHQKMEAQRGVRLDRRFTLAALDKLPADMYAAKCKAVRLGLKKYSMEKRALCNVTGDRYPEKFDRSLGAEKLRAVISDADFQAIAIEQIRNER